MTCDHKNKGQWGRKTTIPLDEKEGTLVCQ